MKEVTRAIKKHPVAALVVAFGVGYVARNTHLNSSLPAHLRIPLFEVQRPQPNK